MFHVKHRGLKRSESLTLTKPAATQIVNEKLAVYRQLLDRYRYTLNLVSHEAFSNLEALVDDAKAYARTISSHSEQASTVVDVGSGAGLPGLVIAICMPRAHVWLVERRKRRSSFLQLATAHLGLDNADVFGGEIADLELDRKADVVVAQAVSRLARLYCITRHVHAQTVMIAGRKGPRWQLEVEELAENVATSIPKPITTALSRHGTLVALRLPGGRECRSSASSTKRVE